jgi:hypothetical protein
MHLCWLNRPRHTSRTPTVLRSTCSRTGSASATSTTASRRLSTRIRHPPPAQPTHTTHYSPFIRTLFAAPVTFFPLRVYWAAAAVLGPRNRPPYTQQPARLLYRGTRRDWTAVLIGFRAVRNNVSTGVPANLPGRHRSRGPQVGGVVVQSPDCAGSSLLSVPISPITLDPLGRVSLPFLVLI